MCSRWTGARLTSLRLARALLLPALLCVQPLAPAWAAQEAVWSGSLPRRPEAGEDIVVSRAAGAAQRISLRKRSSAVAALPPLPLATDILAGVEAEAFGRERRCAQEKIPGGLRLRCRAGSSMAGFVAPLPGARLPRGAPLQLLLESEGTTGFKAEVTSKRADAEALRPLGPGVSTLPLPELGERTEAQLVLVAPAGGGELILKSARIMPVQALARTPDTSAWAWEPERWRDDPHRTLAAARRLGVQRLFVTLEVADGSLRHASELRRFVRLASASGIKVEAVEGDPRMILPQGLDAALVRARAFADYQRNAGADERLSGVQYDVEPYVLPEWGRNPVGYPAWAEAVLRLRQGAGEPVDLVVPFWVGEEEEGQAFLRRVAPAVRILTVMSYRTELPLLTQVAEPLLAWGAAEGVKVRLALEAGSLADEAEQVFRPAARGTLAIMQGAELRVLLLAASGAIPGAQMYAQHSASVVPAQRLSFLGREEAMMELARRAQPLFSAWPSFVGFAFHGLKWE